MGGGLRIRPAGAGDAGLLRLLWEEFAREIPEPEHRACPEHDGFAQELPEYLANGLALVAEEDGRPVGYALAKREPPALCYLADLYVRPDARRRGVAKALLAAVTAWGGERGAWYVTLEVATGNAQARTVYDRLGFAEESRSLFVALPTLAARVAGRAGGSTGSVHVQTDDAEAVARAVRQYLPRLPGRSRGSVVAAPVDGWTAVYDDLCEREPALLQRLAVELSDRMGAVVCAIGVEEGAVVRYVLLERGSVVDEYCSVPEYHGPLPPGDVVALGANPTVVARLTGAEPARVRAVARTAASPGLLPPAPALLAELAAVLGLAGAAVGVAAAREIPGAIVIAP